MITATSDGGSLRIEGHQYGGGYDVFVGKEFIGDADTIKDAVALGEKFIKKTIPAPEEA